jgi:cytochrome c556
MKTPALAAALILALGLLPALAQDAGAPIPARKALMESYGAAAKTLAEMVSGKTPFDPAAAAAAQAVLAAAGSDVAGRFRKLAVDASSKAKGAIWSNWDDFIARAQATGDAAGAMDLSSAEALAPGFAALGETCKACHGSYRM